MATFPAALSPTVRSTLKFDPVNTTNTSKVGFVTQFTGNSSDEYATFVLQFENITSTDYTTLVSFYNDNIGEDIDFTVAGVDYTGTFSGTLQTSYRGDKFTVVCRLYASESA